MAEPPGSQGDPHSRTLERRLRLAHQARRAKEHQLDGIRRALCDIGLIEDDDAYSHADLEDVIRQALGGQEDTASKVAYPRSEGNTIVLGPEVFASDDHEVISWKGENYTRADRPDPLTRSGPHEVTIHNPRGHLDFEPDPESEAPGTTYLAGGMDSRLLLDGFRLCVPTCRPVIIEPFSEGFHGGLIALALAYRSIRRTGIEPTERASDV